MNVSRSLVRAAPGGAAAAGGGRASESRAHCRWLGGARYTSCARFPSACMHLYFHLRRSRDHTMGQWQQGAPRAASALTCRHSRSLLSTVHGQVGGGCVRVSGAHRSTPAPRLCMGRVCESQSTANRHATRKQYCPALPGSAAWLGCLALGSAARWS